MQIILISALLLIAAAIDLKTRTIPPIIPILVLALAPLNQTSSWLNALLGLVVCGGALLFPAFFCKEAFGGGDIKLVAALGYALGFPTGVFGLFLAVTFSLVPCIYYKITAKQSTLAFAPFIAAGYISAMCIFHLF